MKIQNKVLFIIIVSLSVVFIGSSVLYWYYKDTIVKPNPSGSEIPRFQSNEELVQAFKDAKSRFGSIDNNLLIDSAQKESSSSSTPDGRGGGSNDFSETNVQVEGVDEADIIKTDGDYIYVIAKNNLVIAKAYPPETAEILSTTTFENYYPQEIFIHRDTLVVFGSSSYDIGETDDNKNKISNDVFSPRYSNVLSAKLFDISNKQKPRIERIIDIEGSYLTSRKINSDVYLVSNVYPNIYIDDFTCDDIIPKYRVSDQGGQPKIEDMKPITNCTDVGYIKPIQADSFFTVASFSLTDIKKDIQKEVVVGSGHNIYASEHNLYIAQTSWPQYTEYGSIDDSSEEKTSVIKFGLNMGKISLKGSNDIPGHILNQFSMDEFDNHFRIATTKGEVWDTETQSSNNIYILDENMTQVGNLENLAPGEKIYSVRFLGKKGYVVTFKKVDPLFVLDLSNHGKPSVLGKLKIPGYSDYLHPYDENHLIGIGKDTEEASEQEQEGREFDFAWYQGVKMAIFDVTDVENPKELHKVIIGDRGTESEALSDHKAFLFDREKELLVLPITLAEIKGEKSKDNQYGDFTFQGAYVYHVNLDQGFELRGTITHIDDKEELLKTGFYYNNSSAVRRSLYIENVLYTLSGDKLMLNNINNLAKIKELQFNQN